MKRNPSSIGMLLLGAVFLLPGCMNDRKDGSVAQSQQSQRERKPVSETMVIPDGTNVTASLETRLSTDTNRTGDQFVARTTEAILVGGKTVVPAGAKIQGVLRDVKASGRTSGRARMTLVYENMVDSAGKTHPISATPLTLQAASATRGDVEKIAAGGILGGIIGAVAGGTKGAAIGAGAGAGAGTIVMLATKGDEVELDPGQRLNIRMTSATSIEVFAQR